MFSPIFLPLTSVGLGPIVRVRFMRARCVQDASPLNAMHNNIERLIYQNNGIRNGKVSDAYERVSWPQVKREIHK